MANSFIEYTGDGSTTAYTITFNYLATADVKAFLNGTPTTAFSVNGQTLTFNSAPASQTAILIERDTPKANRLVDFSDGAILSEADLDKNANQLFFISQEAVDTADRALSLNSANQFDATVSSTARRIVNMADPVDAQDAVTKNWLTTTYLTPTDITNIGTTGTNIANINTVAGAIANVNSVAGNATNINTVAGNNANINTVAGNNTAISTVAGISSQVTTVANASSNIATVAADIAAVQTVASDLGEQISEIETVAADLQEQVPEIDTVAGAITNVNTVGTNINNVNATGGAITNVNTVAGQISPTNNLGTVAGISTEIGNVAGISSAVSSVGSNIANVNSVAGQISPTNNISTVASNISDIQDVGGNIGAITTVNGISANVSTVAGISSDVTSVAGNSTNITNVANNASNITTVAGAATNINTVAANVTNVGAVANISSDVTTVAGDATDIGTVAGAIANVNSVASNSSNINAVAGNSTNINSVASATNNINTVAGISADVSTVASNVTGVNSFADRYRVGSSNPSSSLDAGDLFFNTTDNALRYYDGSGWQGITGFLNGGTMSGDLTVSSGTNSVPVHTYTQLEIESASHSAIQFSGSTNAEQWIWFADDSSSTPVGGITYNHNTPNMGFRVEGAERARFDSLGRYIIGKTTAGLGTAGHTFDPSGYNYQTRAGDLQFLNRTGSDGVHTRYYRDGSDKGNIGVYSDKLQIGQGNANVQFSNADDAIIPANGSGTVNDNSIDLGTSSARFNDLHLGGNAHIPNISGTTEIAGNLIIDNQAPVLEFQPDGNYSPKIDFSDGGELSYATAVDTFYWTVGGNTSRLSLDSSGNLVAAGNVTAYSDERLKDNIETLDGSKVYEMRGVSFTKDGEAGSGVIAQELQKIAPELVHEDGEYLSVAYGNVVGYLIEAIKDLKAEVEELKNGPSQ